MLAVTDNAIIFANVLFASNLIAGHNPTIPFLEPDSESRDRNPERALK